MFTHSYINEVISTQDRNLQIITREIYDAFEKLRKETRERYNVSFDQYRSSLNSYNIQAKAYLDHVLRAPTVSIVGEAYDNFRSYLETYHHSANNLATLESYFCFLVATIARATIDVLSKQYKNDIEALNEKVSQIESRLPPQENVVARSSPRFS